MALVIYGVRESRPTAGTTPVLEAAIRLKRQVRDSIPPFETVLYFRRDLPKVRVQLKRDLGISALPALTEVSENGREELVAQGVSDILDVLDELLDSAPPPEPLNQPPRNEDYRETMRDFIVNDTSDTESDDADALSSGKIRDRMTAFMQQRKNHGMSTDQFDGSSTARKPRARASTSARDHRAAREPRAANVHKTQPAAAPAEDPKTSFDKVSSKLNAADKAMMSAMLTNMETS
jgi:hypothetical protein